MKRPRVKSNGVKRTLDQLISNTERELEWLNHQEHEEREPLRLAKIRNNFRIKSAFLAKLKSEQ
jgi:hypothetical protein